MGRYADRIREQFRKAMREQASANRIAWSFALGTFLSVLPTPGLSILIGLALAVAIRAIHTVSMVLAFVVWNPLVTAPLYALSFQIGQVLFAGDPVVEIDVPFFVHAYRFTLRFLVGNVLIAVAASLLSYGVLRALVHLHRRRRGATTADPAPPAADAAPRNRGQDARTPP